MNACEIGRTIPSLVGLGGFVASFIKLGATAVIAPLWSVEDSVAHDIATYFYEQLKANPKLPLSEIFKQIRRKGYDPEAGKDTYVAYCFYGDPSAAIAQRITAPWFPPSLTFNFAGDPAAEYRVVTEVASYGKQLGWLTEIAIALANRQPLPEETLRRLEKATKDIDAIKKEVRASSVKAAKNALDDPSMG